MAERGERRMVFDTRGRRKHVIRVVYAILALLMGASLFLVVGPFNLADVINTGSASSASKALEEQAERIERRLAKNPGDEALLLALTRAQIAAGNAQLEEGPGGQPVITPEAATEFAAGLSTWQRYLKESGSKPNPNVAQLVAGTSFSLAESGTSLSEVEERLSDAARAQRAVAEARPNLGSLSTLAIYEYFAGNFAAGDKAAAKAAAESNSKSEAKNIEKQLATNRKRAKQWDKRKRQLAKLERKQGKETLENPLGGFAGGGTGLAP
jgi:hypothetical protein